MKAQQIFAQAYAREIRREKQRRIGDGLRRSYDSTVCEPFPSDWLQLLDDLEASRSSGATTPSGLLERLWKRLLVRE